MEPGRRFGQDLIAAIATATGEAGIGIVRLSGAGAGELVGRLVRARIDGAPAGRAWLISHRLRHGYLIDPDDGLLIDEVMVVRMAAPRTYTREETVEVHTHGGALVVREALGLMLRQGARLAEPGEFTLRAFLNGRLDLTQAEAVAQVIAARTPAGLSLAVDALGGRLCRSLGPARAALLHATAWLEASIDFPEDDVPPVAPLDDLSHAAEALAGVLAQAEAGAIHRDGLAIVLAGRPNVGKSSLMNALLRYDRAIVTPIAGTTRDTLTESINVRGMPFTLIDTAGLTETADVVEQLGVARTREALAQAGLVVLVIDGSLPVAPADQAVLAELRERLTSDRLGATPLPLIVALSKSDLPAVADAAVVRDALGAVPVVRVSALTGDGLPAVEAAIEQAVLGNVARAQADPALLTLRQEASVRAALAHVRAAVAALEQGLPTDIVAVDARAALLCVGEVTGESVTDTLLNEIFSRFCIGK